MKKKNAKFYAIQILKLGERGCSCCNERKQVFTVIDDVSMVFAIVR